MTYTIRHSREHCHRCGELADCIVRVNAIRLEVRKTALCATCAEREQPEVALDSGNGGERFVDELHEVK